MLNESPCSYVSDQFCEFDPSALPLLCGRSPYKVLEAQVYDMQLLGGYTHLSEREVFHLLVWCSSSLSSLSSQQEESVLLVNGEAMCSWEVINLSLPF